MGNHRFHGASSDSKLPVSGMLGTALVAVTSLVIGTAASVHASDEVYEYDALGRLIKVLRPDGTHIEYDLDAVGNRVEKTVTDVSQNSPPVAVDDYPTADVKWQNIIVDLIWNDTDPDNDTLEIIAITQPWNGNVTIVNTTEIRIFGTYVGVGTFTYTVSDGNGGTDIGNVTFTVLSGGGHPGGGGP